MMLVYVPPVTYGHFTYKSNERGMMRQTVKLTNLLDKPLECYKDSFDDLSICCIINNDNHIYTIYLPMFNIKFDTVWFDHKHNLLYHAFDYLEPYNVFEPDDCYLCDRNSNIKHTHKMMREYREKQCGACDVYIEYEYYLLKK